MSIFLFGTTAEGEVETLGTNDLGVVGRRVLVVTSFD
jgi:hypothetical protein